MVGFRATVSRVERSFGPGGAVVEQRPSRHRGLHLTVVALKGGGTRFRAYVHTPEWERIVAVSANSSAEVAAARAENLVVCASERGVLVRLPTPSSGRPASAVQAEGTG
jgi:hypothetical protein